MRIVHAYCRIVHMFPVEATRYCVVEFLHDEKDNGNIRDFIGSGSKWTFEPSAALAILEGWEKRGECENLFVPVCLSASHMAFGSIRMEPVFFALGQAAGTAASMAAEKGTAVQDVPYGDLRKRLLADGQVISLRK